MEILSVFDAAFKPYGRVLTGYDTAALTQTLEHETPLPEGVEYVPSDAALEKLPIFADFEASISAWSTTGTAKSTAAAGTLSCCWAWRARSRTVNSIPAW